MKAYPLNKLSEIYSNLSIKAMPTKTIHEGIYTHVYYDFFEVIYIVTFKDSTLYRIVSDPKP